MRIEQKDRQRSEDAKGARQKTGRGPRRPHNPGGKKAGFYPARTRGGHRPRVAEPCVAAIDLGTHNCRLLIATHDETGANGGIKVVDGFSRIVKLGENITHTGALCDGAIERTVSALKVCAAKMRHHQVVKKRLVATEACRQAGNCQEFFKRVHHETGLSLETIPAEEEATLTLAGCVPLFDQTLPRALMFDIGGGSTELTWVNLEGDMPEPIGMVSLPIGVVTLVDRVGSGDGPCDALNALVREFDDQIDAFDQTFGISDAVLRGNVQLLGTSGTVTTLGALHLDLPRYDRGQVDGMTLEVEDIEALSRKIISMTCSERSKLPCIGPERADLMAMGCAILSAITGRWKTPHLHIADRGIREGLLLSLLGEIKA